MELSNCIVVVLLVLASRGLTQVQAKCTLTPLQGETTIAYVCVHGDLADVAEVPSEAEWIEFTVSRIHYLPPDAFSRFHNLRRLTFYNCDLRQLSPDAFRGLDRLEWLVMSNTKIGLARAALFQHLTNLRRLTLDGAGLVYIEPEVFRGFRRLETLSLRDNDLDCLPIDALGLLTNLKTVQLGKNPWLCDCRSSLSRFFEERRIEHGPEEECVYDMHNKSMRFERESQQCMSVLEFPALPAAQASFEEIERHFRGRVEWRESVATGVSSLDKLPDEIGWIQIFGVEIATIPRYAFFRFGNTLRSIELGNCSIREIEREAFAGLHKLEKLSLTGNQLVTIKHEWFRDLGRLTDLVLRDNGIETLEQNALTHLRSLRRLDVRGNRLRCLPKEDLRGLVALQRFEATGNPFYCECRADLENHLRQVRIGYEISPGRCDHRVDATEAPRDGMQFAWNTTTSGKVRWCWAYKIHRPTWSSTSRPTIATTTTVRTTAEPPWRPHTGGCHLVTSTSRDKDNSGLCRGGSLVELEDFPDTIETIVFSASVLPTIHSDAFRKFGRFLRRLEFRDCAIQNIERHAFSGLRVLETLVIRGNDLDVVRSEWFEETRDLKRLDLAGNGITRISNGVFERLPNLVSLDISDNRMNCIGIEHLEALPHLRRLELVGNPWTCLCARRLVQLMADRRISCNCNPEVLMQRNEGGWGCRGTDEVPIPGPRPLPEMPRPTSRPLAPPYYPPTNAPVIATGSCHPPRQANSEEAGWYRCTNGDINIFNNIPSHATRIEIIDSYIPHLPAMAFNRFPNLVELVLRNCTLRDIDPHAFVGLGSLVKLTLRDNRFAVVKSEWFRETRNLVRLDLSDNYLTEIETGAFEELRKLEYLSLEGNAFQCIYTSCFVDLPRLATLEFGRNPLKWRCWQELRQFLEVRAINYTYYKCPHDGKDLVKDLLKDDKTQAGQTSSAAGYSKAEFTIIVTLLVFATSLYA